MTSSANHHQASAASAASGADQFRFYLSSGDVEYLLRCSLTHDWDHIVQFCLYLKEYIGAAAYKTPKRPMQQLRSCDQYGNSVLQAACYYRPPVIAIRAILQVADKLGIREELLSHKSLDQSTALQVACATGASVAVIEALLLFPNSDDDDTSTRTSHFCPQVIHFDQQGSTPLSELVVQYTLERKGPAHIANSRPLEQVEDVVLECQRSPVFRSFWTKVELLITAAVQNETIACSSSTTGAAADADAAEKMSLLHGAASISHTCPALLCDLLVRCFSHEVSRPLPYGTTRQGWLPLHLAISAEIPSQEENAPLPQILGDQQHYFVSELLRAHPASAQIPLPLTTHWNRSPFCHAVLHGLHWHILATNRKQHNNKGILQLLVEVAPDDAVGQRDEATGYHPWQLAALINCSNNNSKNDLNQLDTIYHILRLYPQALLEE